MEDLKNKIKNKGLIEKFSRIDVEPFGGLGAGKAIDLSFITNDDNLRNKLEKEALDLLKKTDGVKEISSSNVTGKDEISLKLKYDRLAQVNLTALDVAQTVRTAFDGSIVTSLRYEGEDINYRVRIQDPEKFRTESILDLPIANDQGQMISLGYMAELDENPGNAVLKHESGKRAVTITANVDTKIITSAEVNKLLTDTFKKTADSTPGLRMKLGGEQEETITSLMGFLMAVIIAMLAVYFILVIVFDSYLQPVLIMSVVPFAIAGVMLTLIIHGMAVSILALIGVIGLIGVVVNDTIVMISHLNKKIKERGAKFDIIAEGAKERFRPVILTTLTTFAGLTPTAYGLGGDIPTMRPMVLVMAWGLVFATAVTLGFTPLLYSIFKVKKGRK